MRARAGLWHDVCMLRASPGAARMAAAAVLPLLLAGFYWKLLLGPRAVWFASDDSAYQVLPWLEVQARAWRAGEPPLWDPFQWMGQPLLGQAQPAVASPPNWLLGWKPEGAAGWLFLNVYFLLIRWIGAAGMYRLARSLGCGRLVSVLAGFAYATAGWFAFSMRPQMAMGAMWAPWALRHLLRAAELPAGAGSLRQAMLGGFFLGLCWLGGHHQAPLFLSLGFALVWLLYLAAEPRRIASAAAFFLMAGASSALQILPVIEYGRRAVRWVGGEEPVGWNGRVPPAIHSQYSLAPKALPALFLPGYRGELAAFHGGLGLGLGLLGAALMRRRAALALGALALFGVWVSLGPEGGLHRLLYGAVPHFDKARSPKAAVVLLSLALPALAAAGAEQLARHGGRQRWRGLVAALWVAAAVAAGAAVWRRMPGVDPGWWTCAGAAALAVLVWLAGRRFVPAWVFALIATAVTAVESRHIRCALLPPADSEAAARYLRLLASHADIAAYLRARGGHWRVEVDDAAIPYNFGGWHGVEQSQGYLASVTENLYRHEIHAPQDKRLFGVRFRVAPAPSGTHAREVFRGADGANVYEWDEALPRVFTVHEAFRLENRLHAAGVLYGMRDAAGEKTFLPGPVPDLEACAGSDEARIAEYGHNRVVIEARMACRGMVILTDTWFPGWRAAVDGRPVQIHEAYAAVRGVVLEGGRHRVEFRYLPGSALAGGALTALACAAAAACARRRQLN